MTLDIVSILVILFYFIRGYSKGLIVAVFSMVGLLLGIIVALSMAHPMTEWLVHKDILGPHKATVVSYIFLFVMVVVIVRIIANILQDKAKALLLGGVNMFLGGMFYCFLGAILWSITMWVLLRVHVMSHSSTVGSKTYPVLSGLAPWFFSSAGKALPFAADAYNNFESFLHTI